MRIGELARKAGVNIQTIRFYERRRILPAPARTASGYRLYCQRDLVDLRFIKQAQELGLPWLRSANFDRFTLPSRTQL